MRAHLHVIAGGLCAAALALGPANLTAARQDAKTTRPDAAQRSAATDDQSKIVGEAIDVLTELTSAPDNGIPDYLLERAEAIVVIPSLVKGGFIVGAEHGKGIMSARSAETHAWSAPAFVYMTGGSIGWQIGAESVDLVLLVMNRNGVDQLLEDRFTLGGTASVTAGPVGRSAEARTNAQLNSQILAYSRAQGLFAGAMFEGAALHAAEDDTRDFYGEKYSVEAVLNGRVDRPLPAAATQWTSAIGSLAGGAGTKGVPAD